MMKKTLLLYSLLICYQFSAQGGFNNLTSHVQRNMFVEGMGLMGRNNKGGSLKLGYYVADYWAIQAGAVYRKFNYKSYSENIIEGDLGVAYTLYSPRYDGRFFQKFNLALELGGAFESVKVTSTTTLIDPYPKYIYVYGGTQIEYVVSEKVGVIGHARQFYAVNGSKDKLGNWRYDFGLGIRFYLWGKY